MSQAPTNLLEVTEGQVSDNPPIYLNAELVRLLEALQLMSSSAYAVRLT